MGNIFEKAEKFAGTALALLKRTVKAPQLFVYKYGKADFVGAAGDVVNIKRPPLLRARDKGWRTSNAIVVDDLMQSKIQVALTAFPYNAVHLSPEEETLDEVDYVRDVQAPQVQALTEFYEDLVVAGLRGAPYTLGVVYNPASSTEKLNDPRKVASRARKLFQDAKVPGSGRYWLVGSSVSEAIRDFGKLLDVDTSGLPEALRDGVVGKLSGFVVVELDALGEEESYFVHETALALANVAPVVPRGAVAGSSVTGAGGVAITQLWDYDATNAKDRSIVESFAGVAPVLDPEVGADGRIAVDDAGEPRMEFYRAIQVEFGAGSASDGDVWTVEVTGAPTGGTFVLTVDGDDTDTLAYNADAAAVRAALNALAGVSGVKVSGTTKKTVKFTEPVELTADATGLTGGTTPSVDVVKVS